MVIRSNARSPPAYSPLPESDLAVFHLRTSETHVREFKVRQFFHDYRKGKGKGVSLVETAPFTFRGFKMRTESITIGKHKTQ